jgi:FkbM family methyltransferase
MLIPLKEAIDRHQLKIRGIVHVGAHWGQELDDYVANGINDIVFIEPCAAAFKILKARIGVDDRILLFQCACGQEDGPGEIFVETANQGQSNSMLKPKKHLTLYPHIQFPDTEQITVRRLDNLPFHRSRYNLLMMDTQGAELLVLKGAATTLDTIDYIYTEVNSQEIYEGNALADELGAFLTDFQLVESHWVSNHGWGDAIYVRKSLLKFEDTDGLKE